MQSKNLDLLKTMQLYCFPSKIVRGSYNGRTVVGDIVTW